MSEVECLTRVIELLERIEHGLPKHSCKEVHDIVEEIVALRRRISMGEAQ